tara:strand:- start:7920 stop:8048 length:129 start_codon:yes stop_codon:yes gene_type:complete
MKYNFLKTHLEMRLFKFLNLNIDVLEKRLDVAAKKVEEEKVS